MVIITENHSRPMYTKQETAEWNIYAVTPIPTLQQTL